MKQFALLLLCSTVSFAAVSGVVINKSTGKPQPGATVGLNSLGGAQGIELVDQAKSDTEGKFTINHEVNGPYVIRTAFDGITYNFRLTPGAPTTGLTLEVYNASKQPGAAKVSKHMLLFEPAGGAMDINETFIFENSGATAWNNPGVGTLRFFVPTAGAVGEVKATAPGGMAIGAPFKAAGDNAYEVDFPVKPGETRFDVTYKVPYTEGQPYEGKILTKDDNTYLIVPSGVTLAGDGLTDLGVHAQTQAHIFGLTGAASYKIQLTGQSAPAAPAAGEDQGGGGPGIQQILPRVNDQTIPILAVTLGILALGFLLLYRAPGNNPSKETDERGRS